MGLRAKRYLHDAIRRYDLRGWLTRALTRACIRFLTRPVKQYQLKIPVDTARLKRFIAKGDVVLVEGNERISEIIKYLTQSSWSHAALYVGDEPLKRLPALKDSLIERFGEESKYLLVEALPDQGVVLSPLVKYSSFNIRVCRPYNLTRRDLDRLLTMALAQVGHQYDLKNVLDLARYFFPFTLLPRRWQRQVFNFGSGEPTRVICSSMIASLFHEIKFPIIPHIELVNDSAPEEPRFLAVLREWLGWRPAGRLEVFKPTPSTLIIPRDFDLSPYFEVVKFNIIEELKFDYRRIAWVDELGQSHETKLNGSR